VRGIEASNGVGREVSFLFILFDLIIIAFIFSMAWCCVPLHFMSVCFGWSVFI